MSPGAAPGCDRGRLPLPPLAGKKKEDNESCSMLSPEGPRGIEPHLPTMATCLAKQPVWISFPISLPEGLKSTSPNKPLVLESLSQGLFLENED